MVKRLRLSPLTAATGVRIPVESPILFRLPKMRFFEEIGVFGSRFFAQKGKIKNNLCMNLCVNY